MCFHIHGSVDVKGELTLRDLIPLKPYKKDFLLLYQLDITHILHFKPSKLVLKGHLQLVISILTLMVKMSMSKTDSKNETRMEKVLFRPLKIPFNVTWPNKSPCHVMPKTSRRKLKKTKLRDRRHKEASHHRCIKSIWEKTTQSLQGASNDSSLIQGHLFHRRYLKRQFVNPPGSSESSQRSIQSRTMYFISPVSTIH